MFVALLSSSAAAQTSTDLELPGCRDNTLPRNDDSSSEAVALPFTLNFFGQTYSSAFINNNGNITFDEPLGDYVPFNLRETNRVIIVPFFADVDTRPSDGGTVTYGSTTFDGRPAFCVLWDDVGYYSEQTDRRNTFQLLLVSDGGQDFTIVFRYDSIQWELGSASGGVPARAGFANGDPVFSVELDGSGESGAFLDGGPHALRSGQVGSDSPGTYRFPVRGGAAGNDPRNVPPGQPPGSVWWDWPDADGDGLPDYWETSGVYVDDRRVDLSSYGARAGQRDALIFVDVVDGERWNERIESLIRQNFDDSPLDIKVHFVRNSRQLRRSELPDAIQPDDSLFRRTTQLGFTATGLDGAAGSVPALAKYVCVCPDHADGDLVLGEVRYIKGDHLINTVNEPEVLPYIERTTGVSLPREFASDRINAVTTMHELGHLYGLRHHGDEHEPRFDPGYRSIMSYTYSVLGVKRTEGSQTRYTIDFSREAAPVNLDWRLGGDFGALSLVYGQHGERGNFYNQPVDIGQGAEPLPQEAPLDERLDDPETRAITEEAARDLAAPADRDGDGVPDADDECPSEAASTANGCPALPPESNPGTPVPTPQPQPAPQPQQQLLPPVEGDPGYTYPAKLRVARAEVDRENRKVDVYAPLTSRAFGDDVDVTFQAAGRTAEYNVSVTSGDAAFDRIRFQRPITREQAALGTGILTIKYPGNEVTRPQEVRLRAARRPADLAVEEISLQGDRLSANGMLDDRVRGVVRLELSYLDVQGRAQVFKVNTEVDNGRWSLENEQVPAEIAQRGAYVSALFTGYFQRRIRGEMISYQIEPGQIRRP